eukprot:CAMPEP_0197347896 /NCGR_PEP_ID=MMETSP0893-20130614/7848_1 /TAXON_ID=44058 ORGANISM="Aureoumbra lagunensis, Strain CCMP1510" /NCGR_SAMPLE_ID=MMETSP0893 /ASSEMBLY_ACC=CAM_ASM_000539 /LENGTH=253 /DNA_ID=CAMNT_0042858067 /DNA_START=128 /DNA_END=886 /DNA_ORIENTATION=+
MDQKFWERSPERSILVSMENIDMVTTTPRRFDAFPRGKMPRRQAVAPFRSNQFLTFAIDTPPPPQRSSSPDLTTPPYTQRSFNSRPVSIVRTSASLRTLDRSADPLSSSSVSILPTFPENNHRLSVQNSRSHLSNPVAAQLAQSDVPDFTADIHRAKCVDHLKKPKARRGKPHFPLADLSPSTSSLQLLEQTNSLPQQDIFSQQEQLQRDEIDTDEEDHVLRRSFSDISSPPTGGSDDDDDDPIWISNNSSNN